MRKLKEDNEAAASIIIVWILGLPIIGILYYVLFTMFGVPFFSQFIAISTEKTIIFGFCQYIIPFLIVVVGLYCIIQSASKESSKWDTSYEYFGGF